MRRLWQYLKYFLRSQTRFGVHSPFVFDFVNAVLRDRRQFYAFEEIEQMRRELQASGLVIDASADGAASQTMGQERSVGTFVRKAAIPRKYGRLLFRMVNHYRPATILEVGTGAGIATAYLATARRNAQVISLEGEPALHEVAQDALHDLGIRNTKLSLGDFADLLPDALEELQSPGLVLIDGNHRYQPTVDYFRQCKEYADNQTILIFDDIYWSRGMERAWQEIANDRDVTLSIDLFAMGIVFFRKELSKEHVVLWY